MEHRHTETLLPEICKRKGTVLPYYEKLRFYDFQQLQNDRNLPPRRKQ